MISSDVVRALDYAVLAVLGIGVIVCLFGFFSSICLPNCHRRRRNATFYGTWPGRAMLSALGALLLETTNGLGLLCRLYLCIAWGLLQPWFLWLAVLLCRKAINPQPTPRRWSMPCAPCCATRAAAKRSKSEELSQPESPQGELIAAKRSSDANDTPQPDPPKRSDSTGNLSIIGLSLLAALPVAAVQGVVAWMSRMVSGAGWDSDPSSPGHYFFSPYDWGVGAQCPDQLAQNQGCVLCVFPAASTITTCVFAVLYSAWMVWSSREVQGYIINRRLQKRLRMLQALVVLCLVVQVAMAGVSVASSPWEVLFTVCWVVFAFVTTAMVISVAWILVVYPMWSIHRAVSSEAKLSAYAPTTELEMQLVWPQHEHSPNGSIDP